MPYDLFLPINHHTHLPQRTAGSNFLGFLKQCQGGMEPIPVFLVPINSPRRVLNLERKILEALFLTLLKSPRKHGDNCNRASLLPNHSPEVIVLSFFWALYLRIRI